LPHPKLEAEEERGGHRFQPRSVTTCTCCRRCVCCSSRALPCSRPCVILEELGTRSESDAGIDVARQLAAQNIGLGQCRAVKMQLKAREQIRAHGPRFEYSDQHTHPGCSRAAQSGKRVTTKQRTDLAFRAPPSSEAVVKGRLQATTSPQVTVNRREVSLQSTHGIHHMHERSFRSITPPPRELPRTHPHAHQCKKKRPHGYSTHASFGNMTTAF
jgi:hypothetical protein